MTAALPQEPERKYFLDGMRGWAALLVVVHHVFYILGDVMPFYRSPTMAFLSDGQLQVRVFFILSGFALSVGYLQRRDLRLIAALALRRYPRLTIPILLSSLLTLILLECGAMFHQQAAPLVHNEWFLGTFYQLDPSFGSMLSYALFDVYFRYIGAPPYNFVLWTMSIEWYGSMLVFAVLFISHYIRWRFLLYGVVFAALLMMHTPMIAFICGIALADIYDMRWCRELRHSRLGLGLGLASLAAGIAISTWGRSFYNQPVGYTATALCLVAAPCLSHHITRFFELKLSRFLGRISFPLYVIHPLVLGSVFSYAIVALTHNGADMRPLILHSIAFIGITASLLAATAFAPVERQAITLSRRFSAWVMNK